MRSHVLICLCPIGASCNVVRNGYTLATWSVGVAFYHLAGFPARRQEGPHLGYLSRCPLAFMASWLQSVVYREFENETCEFRLSDLSNREPDCKSSNGSFIISTEALNWDSVWGYISLQMSLVLRNDWLTNVEVLAKWIRLISIFAWQSLFVYELHLA